MGPVALRCPSCAAPVAREDVRCCHCGSQLATVACPRCFALVPLAETHCGHCGATVSHQTEGRVGSCPDCKDALARTVLAASEVDQCLRCGGVWMARGTFEHLSEDREIRAAMLGYLPSAEASKPVAAIHYRPCPTCNRLMNRLNYGRISGVIVDVCKVDGVWFDKDELRRVVDFIQAGGLEKARDRQIRELKDAQRLEALGVPLERAGSSSEWTRMPATKGSVFAEIAFDIFDLFT